MHGKGVRMCEKDVLTSYQENKKGKSNNEFTVEVSLLKGFCGIHVDVGDRGGTMT